MRGGWKEELGRHEIFYFEREANDRGDLFWNLSAFRDGSGDDPGARIM
jgi:hypothetical protein